MRREGALLFVFIAFLLLCAGCGSTVSESTRNGNDVSFPDINITDVTVKDVESKDFIDHDIGTDAIVDTQYEDVKKDAELPDIEEDVEIKDSVGSDGANEDVEIKDVVGEDVPSTDVGQDAGNDTGPTYCKVGDEKIYICPNGEKVVECVCEYKGCMPKCDKIGTKSEGWYDCDGNLIRFAQCKDCTVKCDALGTKSEGWYSDCDGLIKWDQCAPEWKCVDDPASLCKTYCKNSCDCPSDKPLCVNGICDSPILVGCNGDNNLCPCGKYCAGNVCSDGTAKCLNSCDCKTNQVCVNETCKDKYTNDCSKEPCPCGQHCTIAFGGYFCQKGCETNCDCPADNPICVNGICSKLQTPNCGNDDRNCPCMEVCVNGTCQKATDVCDSSCDCKDPTKPSCINMVCSKTPDKCTSDNDCPCKMACVEGSCKEVTRCLDSCDCAEKEVCKNYICTPKTDNNCFNSTDCPCNYLCQNFQCVQAQKCKYSCDCPQNQQPPLICRNNLCQPMNTNRCTTDNDCSCGNYCSNNGFCVQGCNDGCDCPKDIPYCLQNRCSPVLINGCVKDQECRCGEICKSGMCITP